MRLTASSSPRRSVLAPFVGFVGLSVVAGILITAMVAPLAAVVGVASNSTVTLFEELPDYLEVGALQQKTELYGTSNGGDVKFAEFYNQNREEVELEQISPHVINAAISTEDPRFRDHGGVDVISATRALAMSVVSDSGAGASTITMQYVRNVRVQTAESMPDPEERAVAYAEATETTAGRKLQEMRLAIGVEQQFSKDEILRGYLNIALFGGTIYGIESAAQYYFGKSAQDLQLQEAASLIATVQSPNAYRLDVEENVQANKERRDYVLMRMLEEGAIDQATYDATIPLPVEPNITAPSHGCENASNNANYFCDYVRNVILQNEAFGGDYDERLFNFQTKGYKIYTTINLDLQAQAATTMQTAVPASVPGMELGAAASMVEAGTGRVLAMTQNTTFGGAEDGETPGITAVNYNTDYQHGGSTGFQVGSTYKIFTLAEWLASGKSLNATIAAQDRAFQLANFQNTCEPGGGGTWSPRNDGGQRAGTVSIRQATSSSLNTAYVAMAEQLDQCRIRDTAMALGAQRADGEVNESNPAAVLGTNTIAPISMATAIAGLANKGMSCSPIAIDRIEDRNGSLITPPESSCQQAVTPEVAAGVNSALTDVVTGGTGSASNPGIAPMVGKTGTTDDGIQTWMVGATSKVGLAVWVGNVSGTTPLYGIDLPLAAGNQTRHAIFRDVMSGAMNTYGGDAFTPPTGSAVRTEQVSIPDLNGLTVGQARPTLEALGLSVTVGNARNSDAPSGTIVQTLPSANTRVPVGTAIVLTPSAGPTAQATQLEVPELTGLTQDEATAALAELGFFGTVRVSSQPDPRAAAGVVTVSNPRAGEPLAEDGELEITVSTGP